MSVFIAAGKASKRARKEVEDDDEVENEPVADDDDVCVLVLHCPRVYCAVCCRLCHSDCIHECPKWSAALMAIECTRLFCFL